MRKAIKFIICISIPLIMGAVSGYATSNGINTWYTFLHKPSFNPPNYLFGPVWTILYILMGVSLYLISESHKNKLDRKAIFVFSIQLLLNFCWSFLFFMFHMPGIALIEIIILWVSIISMISIFYNINKTAALLQIPYLLWVSFATVLNAAIWHLN